MIQPSVGLTVVCYSNYTGPVHNPDFLFYNHIMSSFANAVYEQCQDCGQCPYQLCYCDCYFYTAFQTGKNLTG